MNLTTDEMMTLFLSYLNTAYTFDGRKYQQVKCTSKWSPKSKVIAETALQGLQKEVLPRCQPYFWARYADEQK